MTILRSVLFGIAFYGGTIVFGTLYLPLLMVPTRVARPFFLAWADYAMLCSRWVAGIRHELRFAEGAHFPEAPTIYAAKHQSAWETIAFNRLIPNPVFVLKQELNKIPFFGWYLGRMGHIAIDRSAGPAAMRSLVTQGREAISLGRSIVIYPQGTRVAPGRHVPYHPGVFALYKALNRPVVPIALDSGRRWARNGFIKRAGVVTVSVLPAIEPGLDRKMFMARLEETIEAEARRLEAEACG